MRYIRDQHEAKGQSDSTIGACGGPSSPTDLRGSVYTHGAGAIFICFGDPQDLHKRILLDWGALRHLRGWYLAHEYLPTAAGQQTVLRRD